MQLIQNEPSWNWTALVSLSRRKHERRQVREASCEVFCSCDSEFAIFPLGAAVWHANCDRHKLPMTAKFCADCDLTLAMDRCSHLAEFQMGYLHEVPPGQVEDTSPENSLRAIKFIFFSSWAAFPFVGVPDHGRRVTPPGIIRTQQQELALVALAGWGLLAIEVSGGSTAVDAASAMAAIIAAKSRPRTAFAFSQRSNVR